MSQIEAFRKIFIRDLNGLKKQIDAYPDDYSIWLKPDGINNSAGNLAMHLAGNLRHFIGAVLNNSGYVRDRDNEFNARDLSRDELLSFADNAINELNTAFTSLNEETLDTEYPLTVGGVNISTRLFITQLVVHFGYHLGQLDYHRRLVTSSKKTVDVITMPELKD